MEQKPKCLLGYLGTNFNRAMRQRQVEPRQDGMRKHIIHNSTRHTWTTIQVPVQLMILSNNWYDRGRKQSNSSQCFGTTVSFKSNGCVVLYWQERAPLVLTLITSLIITYYITLLEKRQKQKCEKTLKKLNSVKLNVVFVGYTMNYTYKLLIVWCVDAIVSPRVEHILSIRMESEIHLQVWNTSQDISQILRLRFWERRSSWVYLTAGVTGYTRH